MTCPELIVARFVYRELKERETVTVTGALQYSDFEGFADTFKSKELDYPYPIGSVIALSALDFDDRATVDQYDEERVRRELDMFYAGFNAVGEKSITSGILGCGKFEVFNCLHVE